MAKFQEWWRERQARRAGKWVSRQIDASLRGKPPWAMHARLLAATWIVVQGTLSEYLDAIERGERPQIEELGTKLEEQCARAINQAREIPLPQSEACVRALSQVVDTARRRGIPTQDALDTVVDFIQATYA